MDKIITSFVGLDVHKDSIAMGVASDWLHPAASRKLGFRLVLPEPLESIWRQFRVPYCMGNVLGFRCICGPFT